MFRILFCLMIVGCAPVKRIHIISNAASSVTVNGYNFCETPCDVKISKKDTTQISISVMNKKNYFQKYFPINGTMFSKDTTLEVNF